MKIFINDQICEASSNITLQGALDAYIAENNAFSKPYVVAINQAFVPKGQYETTLINEGDKIELLSPMAGG